jgi:uncharacterized damage-inducible protein DinB
VKLLEYFPYWAEVRGALLDLVKLIPDEDLGWSPSPSMMSFSCHVLHIAEVTDYWLGHVVLERPYRDIVLEDEATGSWRPAPSFEGKAALTRELGRSYALVDEILGWDAAKRAERYVRRGRRGDETHDLHWILHHTLDHEIHHRAYVAAYLRLRGIPPQSDKMP